MLTTKLLQATLIFVLSAIEPITAQTNGVIQGKVSDISGAPILGAVVTVDSANETRRTTATSIDGAFELSNLPPGNYKIKVSANGLSDWTASNIPVGNTASPALSIVLNVAPSVTTVTVGLSPQEVATEQLKQAEKQRALGLIPNFFVTYDKQPAPLSPKQKLQLGWRTIIDPATFTGVGITAAIQQKQNSYWQFGQGVEGFAKRYGAAYATAADGVFVGGVVMDSIFRQDPRYFYSGEGSRFDRFRYAMKASFFVKGDNGRWQFPYADLSGMVAASEIAQTYLPGSRTQYTLLGRAVLFHFVGRVGLNLGEEFLLKKVTTNAPADKIVADRPVLREGTPVPLIAVHGLTAQGAVPGKTVSFVLAQDLSVDGKVIVKTGAIASGRVDQVSAPDSAGAPSSVGLEQMRLRAGDVDVPLRSNQVRGGTALMKYRELPNSDKVEITLYVAENVPLPDNQN